MKSALSDYLQIWGFENNDIIFSDGSFGFGLELTSLDSSCWSNSQINEFSQRVYQFLSGLPELLDIQFVQDITSGNSLVIQAHEETGRACENEIVNELTKLRCKKLIELDQTGQLPKQTLRLFIRKKPKESLLKKSGFFKKSKDFSRMAEDKLQIELLSLQRTKADLLAGLTQLGISCFQIETDEIVNLLYKQWNPVRDVPISGYDPDDIRHSLLFTDVSLYDRGFSLGDMHYRVVSLKLLPDATFATMSSALRELPFDSRLQMTIHIPEQQRELEALQIQRRIAYSMVSGKKSGVSDLDSEAKFRDLEVLLEQMVAQGEKVFHMSLQVILRAKSPDELDDYVSQTLLKIRELAGAEGMEETLAAFDIFSESALPNTSAKERVVRVKTSNLKDLLPLYGPWVGHKRPVILLRSRLGNLLSFDTFSSDLTSSNQIVSGGSGSGKSFLVNLLLMQSMKENPKTYIIDIGGSYKKLCEYFEGQYLPLGVS